MTFVESLHFAFLYSCKVPCKNCLGPDFDLHLVWLIFDSLSLCSISSLAFFGGIMSEKKKNTKNIMAMVFFFSGSIWQRQRCFWLRTRWVGAGVGNRAEL